MNILNFAIEHKELIIAGECSLVCWLLPNPKLTWLGKKASSKIPPKVAKIIKEKLDAFEEGLIACEFDGNKNIIHNDQIKEKTEKLKIDLGLEQK